MARVRRRGRSLDVMLVNGRFGLKTYSLADPGHPRLLGELTAEQLRLPGDPPVDWTLDADGDPISTSRAMVSSKERYGKGPTKARTYISDALAGCLLEGGFLKGERTLAYNRRGDAVADQREAFQEFLSEQQNLIIRKARPVAAPAPPRDVGGRLRLLNTQLDLVQIELEASEEEHTRLSKQFAGLYGLP